MRFWIRYAAITVNILALLFLFLITGHNRVSPGEQEFLFVILIMLVPAVSLWALVEMPDLEERKLLRSVRKARLRRELKELGE